MATFGKCAQFASSIVKMQQEQNVGAETRHVNVGAVKAPGTTSQEEYGTLVHEMESIVEKAQSNGAASSV
eukprot:12424063-Karenia_brevis.AAC.1